MAQRPDRVAALSRINAPTLVISGTHDVFIPSSEGEAMHRAIAGSTFIDIAGAGHLSNIDTPGEFNRIVEDFLQSIARDERP
jgi:pimeloyl-ACP methyl ester carboxylesterase